MYADYSLHIDNDQVYIPNYLNSDPVPADFLGGKVRALYVGHQPSV